MENKIRLYKVTGQGLMAQFIGPHKAEIESLFGTDTISTAFTENANIDYAIKEIEKLNPNTEVFYSVLNARINH